MIKEDENSELFFTSLLILTLNPMGNKDYEFIGIYRDR